MPVLKIYNEDKELILVSQEFHGDKGWGLLTDLLPNTTYEEGTYFVSWEDKNYETEKIPVPRFTTESSTNKELVFYFKDALTVKPMTAYDIAVKNGFSGTEKEWVESIKGEPGAPGVDATEGGSAYDYWLAQGNKGTKEDFLFSLKGKDGNDGEDGKDGKDFTYQDFTDKQLENLKGEKGEPGADGASAYEIALEKGFVGNIQDFLDSLVGKSGRDGRDGYDGLSAYQIAKEYGYKGTEQEWLNSLKGEKGKDFKFSDFTTEQLKQIKGEKGDPFTYQDFTEEQLENLKGSDGKNTEPLDVINELNKINNKVSLDNYNLKAFLNTKYPLQSFIYTDDYIYGVRLEPQKTRTQDDITLIRFSESGTMIDSMKILGVGHIENLGYKDEWFYTAIFSDDGANKKIIKTKYIKGDTISYETTDNSNLITLPINLENEVNKLNVNVFDNIINLMFYNGVDTGITLKSYSLDDFSLINTVTVGLEYSMSWLQGCVASDEKIYLMIGDHTFGNYKHITSYFINDGSISETRDISTVGADDVGNRPLNDWLEPEGLQILQKEGRNTLIQGVFTGGSTTIPTQKRFKLYEWKEVTKNQSDYLAFSNHSDAIIFEITIQGNNSNIFSMIETAKNYKWLTFYYTAGIAGTHTITIPTDLLKMVKYVDLECDAITNNSEFYKYITRVTFEDDLKQFSITTSRMLKVDITDLTESQTTKDNYAGFYLYKIKGHQLYSEYDL